MTDGGQEGFAEPIEGERRDGGRLRILHGDTRIKRSSHSSAIKLHNRTHVRAGKHREAEKLKRERKRSLAQVQVRK